jgi:Rv0623-like transcription factor
MTKIKTRIKIEADGTITGRAAGLPAGEHDAAIELLKPPAARVKQDADALLARVRAIQAELARLPVLDARNPDEIIGYDERGLPH